MILNDDMQAEINVLLQFPLDNHMNGIKIHNDAEQSMIDAAKRLFEKGFIDASDGGYLTDAGRELQDHLHGLYSALK